MTKLSALWKIEELRKKLLFTLAILVLFRIGSCFPVPFVSREALDSLFNGGNFLSYLNMVSGSSLAKSTVFALGVGPAINASIIMQLLCVAIPKWETLSKDDTGKKQIDLYTRICTLVISVLMSVGYFFVLRNYGALKYTTGAAGVFSGVAITAIFVAGSMVVNWFGELIDEKGIGNGMSLIIFAGIVSGWSGFVGAYNTVSLYVSIGQWWYILIGIGLILVLLAAMLFVVRVDEAERPVAVIYASSHKRKGGKSFIPLKLIMSGVMPVIFAGSILSVPSVITAFMREENHPKLYSALNGFTSGNWLYMVLYILLIFAFNYFYISIQYNPVETAENLRKAGGTVPGIRPGKPTADYISKAISEIMLSGSVILALIAVTPILLGNLTGISIGLGGTSLLIIAGVATELMKSVDSYTTMRYHGGFLD